MEYRAINAVIIRVQAVMPVGEHSPALPPSLAPQSFDRFQECSPRLLVEGYTLPPRRNVCEHKVRKFWSFMSLIITEQFDQLRNIWPEEFYLRGSVEPLLEKRECQQQPRGVLVQP